MGVPYGHDMAEAMPCDQRECRRENFEGAFVGGHFLNREVRKRLFFEFKQAHIFQVNGTTCGPF